MRADRDASFESGKRRGEFLEQGFAFFEDSAAGIKPVELDGLGEFFALEFVAIQQVEEQRE